MSASAGRERLPIVQYWHCRELPEEIAEMTATIRECNPEYRYRLFCRSEAQELISEHFGDREISAFNACAVPAMQADYFRYCAVHALGGVYIDAGFSGVRGLTPLFENGGGGALFKDKGVINGFFGFSAPGHPLLGLAIDIATINIERRRLRKVNVATGPWVLVALTELLRLGSFEAARDAARNPSIRIRGPRPWELKLLVDSCIDAIGDYERVVEAFADVRIVTIDRISDFLSHKNRREMLYKQHEDDWSRWQHSDRSIFR